MAPLQNGGHVIALSKNPRTRMYLHHSILFCSQRDGTTQNISPNSDKTSWCVAQGTLWPHLHISKKSLLRDIKCKIPIHVRTTLLSFLPMNMKSINMKMNDTVAVILQVTENIWIGIDLVTYLYGKVHLSSLLKETLFIPIDLGTLHDTFRSNIEGSH
jgi:hypothetical protein